MQALRQVSNGAVAKKRASSKAAGSKAAVAGGATSPAVPLPQTTMSWRAWLPVLGPMLQMFDAASDAVSSVFALRKSHQPAAGAAVAAAVTPAPAPRR